MGAEGIEHGVNGERLRAQENCETGETRKNIVV